MTAIGALVVGLILTLALVALIAFLAGVPILAIVFGSVLTGAVAFYVITNRLVPKAAKKDSTIPSTIPAPEKNPITVPKVGISESDHIS